MFSDSSISKTVAGVVSSISVTNFVIKVFSSFCNCLPIPLVVEFMGILMSIKDLVLVLIVGVVTGISEAVDTVVVDVGVVVVVGIVVVVGVVVVVVVDLDN